MVRSKLDPPSPTPIGSLGDKAPDGGYAVLPAWATVSAISATTTAGIGPMLVYGQIQEQQYFTPSEGGTTPEADQADFDPQQSEAFDADDPESAEVFKQRRNDLQDPDKAASVTAEFYFDQVKAGMTKLQQRELKNRVADLTATLQMASRDQIVLREETQRLLAVALLQQKAATLGYGTVVDEDIINRFRSKVEMKRPDMMELKDFPRVLPKKVREALAKVKKANLFDKFSVLTWNPRQEQVEAVKDRIVKKDPILFAQFSFDPFYHYYITSWEDETCDLTFDKMVASLKELDPEFEPARVMPLTEADADRLIEAAQGRAALLKGTNSKRYRTDALETSLAYEDFTLAGACRLLKALLKQLSATARRKKATKSRV